MCVCECVGEGYTLGSEEIRGWVCVGGECEGREGEEEHMDG